MSDAPRPDERPVAQDVPARTGQGGADIVTDDAGLLRPDEPAAGEPAYHDGSQIVVRSQWALFRRRFLRHKLAMGSLLFLLIVVIAAIFAERIAPYHYTEIDVVMRSTPPTFEGWHLFGTDQLGRDYFSRVIYGTRISLQVAGLVAVISTAIGTTLGAIAGYYRGWVDAIIMRFADLIIIVPLLAVLLIAAAFIGQGRPMRIGVIIALLSWPSLARIVRGVFLSLREKEYVQAARASGAGDFRIMFRHMLPNTMGPILVNMTLVLAAAILLEATLAFLGLGVNPPTPALGLLINDGRSSMLTSWWLIVMPGLAIVAIALAINFVGDGLRDALDPTQQEK